MIQRPQAVSLEEFAQKFLVPRFEMGGSEVRLRANREIRLSCGTRAFRSRIDWMWKDRFLLTTDLVTAYRRERPGSWRPSASRAGSRAARAWGFP
ncbi:MAG: hypothetical protein JRF59_10800 [Deltaproteobacteria bacterium]|nr:hypothetical protein [Deltaproteobacteria bacterium]